MLKLAGVLAALAFAATPVFAGPEKVAFPEGYQTHFIRYATVDKPKRKTVRFFYVNPEALAQTKPGQDAPHGTVLIMEDHKAKLDADGNPLTDSRGRFIPTTELTNVFVQEKQPGWGSEYPSDKRNGEWEYAWFEPTGERKTGSFVKFGGCFACHKENAEFTDFNFTPFIASIKQ